MRRLTSTAFALLASLVLFPGAASAQARTDTTDVCFRGRPLARCKAFLITEVGVYPRLFGSRVTERYSYPGAPGGSYPGVDVSSLSGHLAWELGGMLNRDSNTAVGATVLLGLDERGGRVGLKGRYRRWLSPITALDVGAGIVTATAEVPVRDPSSQPYGPQTVEMRGTGLTGDVHVNLSDLIAIGTRADLLYAGGHVVGANYIGVRGGTYTAVGATALIAAWTAFLFSVIATGDY